MSKEPKCPFYKIPQGIEENYPCDVNLVKRPEIKNIMRRLMIEDNEFDQINRAERFAIYEILINQFLEYLPEVEILVSDFFRVYEKDMKVISADWRITELVISFFTKEFEVWENKFESKNQNTSINKMINFSRANRQKNMNTPERGFVTAIESFFCYANVAAILSREESHEPPSREIVMEIMENSRHLFFKLSSLFVTTFLTIDRVLKEDRGVPRDQLSLNVYDPKYFQLTEDRSLEINAELFLKDHNELGLDEETLELLNHKRNSAVTWIGCPGRNMIHYVCDFLEKVILQSKVQFDGIPSEFTCTDKV